MCRSNVSMGCQYASPGDHILMNHVCHYLYSEQLIILSSYFLWHWNNSVHHFQYGDNEQQRAVKCWGEGWSWPTVGGFETTTTTSEGHNLSHSSTTNYDVGKLPRFDWKPSHHSQQMLLDRTSCRVWLKYNIAEVTVTLSNIELSSSPIAMAIVGSLPRLTYWNIMCLAIIQLWFCRS